MVEFILRSVATKDLRCGSYACAIVRCRCNRRSLALLGINLETEDRANG